MYFDDEYDDQNIDHIGQLLKWLYKVNKGTQIWWHLQIYFWKDYDNNKLMFHIRKSITDWRIRIIYFELILLVWLHDLWFLFRVQVVMCDDGQSTADEGIIVQFSREFQQKILKKLKYIINKFEKKINEIFMEQLICFTGKSFLLFLFFIIFKYLNFLEAFS